MRGLVLALVLAPLSLARAEELPQADEAGEAETTRAIDALKERYQKLRAERDAVLQEQARLDGSAGRTSTDDGKADGDKSQRRSERKLGAKGTGAGPSTGAVPPRRPPRELPPEERKEKLEARLSKIEDELRAIEREAEERYGLGSAGLMKAAGK